MSRLCWDMVRQRHDIEEQHYVLHVPVPEITQDEYLAAEPRLLDELREAGLAQGIELAALMRLLARPQLELHGWIDFPNGVGVGVVVAADDQGNAVLAAVDDAAIHLRPVQRDKLAEALVDVLPPCEPARGHSITVPMDTSPRSGWLEPNTLPGRLESDRRALRRLLSRPRLGGGRIYAGARDTVGRRRKTQYPLTYLDLEDGRWILQQKPGEMGKPWLVAVPGTPAALTGGLANLLDTLSS